MALDFQQIHQQVKIMGENALVQARQLHDLREQALELLRANAENIAGLRQKVQHLVHHFDPSLRCALPVQEPLDASYPLPALPLKATILAADGSQISPDRHAEVEFGLINVGAIQLRQGSPEAAITTIESRLLYAGQLESLTEATLALRRDLDERKLLARLAEGALAPVITFTDGPMELWGGRAANLEEATLFQKSLEEYRQVLQRLYNMQVVTSGYVDKPAAQTVIRLLEIAAMTESSIEIKKHPLDGLRDIDLYRQILKPGERSAVFAIQSPFSDSYPGELALHFFYLKVGDYKRYGMARVEVPAWVAQNSAMLNDLHAVLIHQCRIMGTRPYPYLLHRAHETALVSVAEKEQVTQMIALELRRRGLEVEGVSHKQAAKNMPGRKKYQRGG